MLELKTKTKKWGNSIGVIIPKEIIREEAIKPNQEVTLWIKSRAITKVKDIFGKWKFEKSTKKLMKELDKEFDLGF